jgi:hypothetical protein
MFRQLSRVFFRLFTYVLAFEIKLSKGGVAIPLTGLNSATLCAYPSQARTWLSNGIYHGPLCVQ